MVNIQDLERKIFEEKKVLKVDKFFSFSDGEGNFLDTQITNMVYVKYGLIYRIKRGPFMPKDAKAYPRIFGVVDTIKDLSFITEDCAVDVMDKIPDSFFPADYLFEEYDLKDIIDSSGRLDVEYIYTDNNKYSYYYLEANELYLFFKEQKSVFRNKNSNEYYLPAIGKDGTYCLYSNFHRHRYTKTELFKWYYDSGYFCFKGSELNDMESLEEIKDFEFKDAVKIRISKDSSIIKVFTDPDSNTFIPFKVLDGLFNLMESDIEERFTWFVEISSVRNDIPYIFQTCCGIDEEGGSYYKEKVWKTFNTEDAKKLRTYVAEECKEFTEDSLLSEESKFLFFYSVSSFYENCRKKIVHLSYCGNGVNNTYLSFAFSLNNLMNNLRYISKVRKYSNEKDPLYDFLYNKFYKIEQIIINKKESKRVSFFDDFCKKIVIGASKNKDIVSEESMKGFKLDWQYTDLNI